MGQHDTGSVSNARARTKAHAVECSKEEKSKRSHANRKSRRDHPTARLGSKSPGTAEPTIWTKSALRIVCIPCGITSSYAVHRRGGHAVDRS